jgi:hypothetical protein
MSYVFLVELEFPKLIEGSIISERAMAAKVGRDSLSLSGSHNMKVQAPVIFIFIHRSDLLG